MCASILGEFIVALSVMPIPSHPEAGCGFGRSEANRVSKDTFHKLCSQTCLRSASEFKPSERVPTVGAGRIA